MAAVATRYHGLPKGYAPILIPHEEGSKEETRGIELLKRLHAAFSIDVKGRDSYRGPDIDAEEEGDDDDDDENDTMKDLKPNEWKNADGEQGEFFMNDAEKGFFEKWARLFPEADVWPQEETILKKDGPEERSEKEQKNNKIREEMLQKGSEAAQRLGAKEVVSIPEEAAKLAEEGCFLLQKVWKNPDEVQALMEDMETINKQILDVESGKDHLVPYRKLIPYIAQIRFFTVQWGLARASDRAADEEFQKKYAFQAALQISTILEAVSERGLSWRGLLTAEVTPVLMEVLHAAEGTLGPGTLAKIHEYLQRDWLLATPGQKSIAAKAGKEIQSLIRLSKLGQDAPARQAVKMLEKMNQKLIQHSNEVGISCDAFQLPMKDIKKLCGSIRLGLGDDKVAMIAQHANFMAKFFEQIGYLELAQASLFGAATSLQGIQLSKDDQLRLEQSLPRPLLKYTVEDDDPSSSSEETASQAQGSEDTAMDTTPPSSIGGTEPAQTKAMPQTQTQAKPNQATFTEKTTSSGLRKTVVDGPLFDNGVTFLGKVEWVQKVAEKGYRAMVNIGTENIPVYKSFPGAAFGRGNGETLHSQFKEPEVPGDLRTRRANQIQSVKAIVEVTGRKSMFHREPVTKYLVEWNKEKVAGPSPDLWISRTDLIGICGRDYESRIRGRLLEDWRYNLAYLEQSREKNLHPETGKPLTQEDGVKTPWLCRTGEVVTKPQKRWQRAEAGVPGGGSEPSVTLQRFQASPSSSKSRRSSHESL